MQFVTLLLSALTMAASQAASCADFEPVALALTQDAPLSGQARFSVSMPQLPDDVVYDLRFTQIGLDSDSLAPASYLIEWASPDASDKAGFCAYYQGHHYRYNGDHRLQEYHMEWDSIPFMPSVPGVVHGRGVQRTARFTDILPAFMYEQLDRLLAPGADAIVKVHGDTVIGGRRMTVIEAVTPASGAVGRESEYVFDRATGLPVKVTFENNPGQVSEQTVTVDYDFSSPDTIGSISERMLIDRYPEVFASMRRSNFRIENLRGRPLPGFSLPTTTGERYSRAAGDPLHATTLIALMECGGGFNADQVAALREAASMAAEPVEIVWIYTDANADCIESETGPARAGEHLLMSGRGVARDCGASMLPTVLIVDRRSVVRDVMIGYNQQLASDVIQKIALM